MQLKNIAAAAAFASMACAQNASVSITDALSGLPQLSNLTTFITQFPDLVTQLGAATNITVLAPDNDAFTKLLSALGGTLPPSDVVEALLTYHVVNGAFTSQNITATPAFLPTLLSNTSYSNVTGGQVVEALLSGSDALVYSGLLANSTITTTRDIQFKGGYIHVIDTVLTIPANISTTALAANLTAAAGALTSANLISTVDTTPELTVFIPNNDAFARIGSALPNLTTEQLTSILEYHVVPGVVGYSSILTNTSLPTLQGGNVTITIEDGSVFVNSAKVVIPNILVANGVVHVIDNVLNPDNTTATPNPTASIEPPAFPGATSVTGVPLTSGLPTPATTIATAAPTGAGGSGASASGGGGASPSSLSQAGAAAVFGAHMPMKTGVVGVAALVGAGVGVVGGMW